MHFLGMAGLPRRIPDYADGYQFWNTFMTLGSFLTLLSLIIFVFLVLFRTIDTRREETPFSAALFSMISFQDYVDSSEKWRVATEYIAMIDLDDIKIITGLFL
jgi:heme/copper-type cytochrome/quinol oxidase subunit 1